MKPNYVLKFPSDKTCFFSVDVDRKVKHKWAWLADRFFSFFTNWFVLSLLFGAIALSFGLYLRWETTLALTIFWYEFFPKNTSKIIMFEHSLESIPKETRNEVLFVFGILLLGSWFVSIISNIWIAIGSLITSFCLLELSGYLPNLRKRVKK